MKSFLKIFYTNIPIKILAILIAIGLWVYVVNVGTQIGTVSAKIPVQIYNISDSLALSNQIPDIQIKVKAPQGVFQSLSAKDFTAFIDAAGLQTGTQNLDVRVVSDVAGVQILEKSPNTVEVTLSKKSSEQFPVNLQTTGKLADGFGTSGDATITPSSVTVAGAKDNIDKVAKVVALVTLSGEQTEVTQSARLKALDKDGKEINNLGFSPDAVSVKIPVERQNDTKTVGIKVNITGTPPSGFSIGNISTDRASVTISGKSSALSNIQFLETEGISVASKTQTFTRTVTLVAPEGVQIQDTSSVGVTIEITSVTKQKSLNAEVLFVGVGNGLKVTSKAPSTVTVIVSGSQSVVDALKDGDVKIQIDLQGKSAGTYNINLSKSNISAPSNVQIQSFNPQSVSVTLGQSS